MTYINRTLHRPNDSGFYLIETVAAVGLITLFLGVFLNAINSQFKAIATLKHGLELQLLRKNGIAITTGDTQSALTAAKVIVSHSTKAQQGRISCSPLPPDDTSGTHECTLSVTANGQASGQANRPVDQKVEYSFRIWSEDNRF